MKLCGKKKPMRHAKYNKDFIKKLYYRPEKCPKCNKITCSKVNRIFCSPTKEIICPYCGCKSHTPFYAYVIPITCTTIAAVFAYGPPDQYVSRRTKGVLLVAFVVYIVSMFLMTCFVPLKPTDKRNV